MIQGNTARTIPEQCQLHENIMNPCPICVKCGVRPVLICPSSVSTIRCSLHLTMAVKPASVLDLLLQRKPALGAQRLSTQHSESESASTFGGVDNYLASVLSDIDAGRTSISFKPSVNADSVLAAATALLSSSSNHNSKDVTDANVLALACRPDAFIWDPELLIPGLRIRCIFCGAAITSKKWTAPKTLHGLSKLQAYVTVKYRCQNCVMDPVKHILQDSKAKRQNPRRERTFQGDDQMLMNTLPDHARAFWKLANTGKIICEASVVDFIRALATRASWSAIADGLNELKTEAWHRDVVGPWKGACKALGIRVLMDAPSMPDDWRLSAQWVRNVYVTDATHRQAEVCKELAAQCGDEVLVVDWTIDAAARCSSNALFNAMDGRRRILLSALTETCAPSGVEHFLAQLAHRGVHPLVVYVDCECCGEWPRIVQKFWKDAVVKLDGMHAIRRLTRTTSSTQHPWHDRFCCELSNAIYTYDHEVSERLKAARDRGGLPGPVPPNVKGRFVPRVITNARQIAASIDKVLDAHSGSHASAGPLTTPKTLSAWRELRSHVLAGCLCDPPNISMNVLGDSVTIGGEFFHQISTRRGASALEGFHTHQKQWLGSLARHAADAGAALLADGALRWNRKRRREE